MKYPSEQHGHSQNQQRNADPVRSLLEPGTYPGRREGILQRGAAGGQRAGSHTFTIQQRDCGRNHGFQSLAQPNEVAYRYFSLWRGFRAAHQCQRRGCGILHP